MIALREGCVTTGAKSLYSASNPMWKQLCKLITISWTCWSGRTNFDCWKIHPWAFCVYSGFWSNCSCFEEYLGDRRSLGTNGKWWTGHGCYAASLACVSGISLRDKICRSLVSLTMNDCCLSGSWVDSSLRMRGTFVIGVPWWDTFPAMWQCESEGY